MRKVENLSTKIKIYQPKESGINKITEKKIKDIRQLGKRVGINLICQHKQ